MLTIIVTPQAHRTCTSPTGGQSHEHRARGFVCPLTHTRGTLLCTPGQQPFPTLPAGQTSHLCTLSLRLTLVPFKTTSGRAYPDWKWGVSRIKHVSLPHPSRRPLKAKQPGQLYSLKGRSGAVLLNGWPGIPTTRIKPLKP